ncbi:LolA family protein [Natronobiforma cellulositropha]|uniref:LolA family protein n=1 Tax=Natronobiforma cellulositropha TaxID=1679076 RepID=UPI0021D590FD|nr:outer membrane lipoprotein carrier protein LolA [Natronobiforma cellulositropha]
MGRQIRATVAIVALVVVLAGCSGFTGGEETDRTEALAERLADAEPPASVEAVRAASVETDGDRKSITTHVWLRGDGATRVEGVDEPYVVVTDGERAWNHDLETDSVSVLELAASDESRLERLYAEQQRYVENLEIETVEETTVDGREALRVAFESPPTETVERSIDLLVGDTVYQLPLETATVEDGEANALAVTLDEETLFPLEFRLETAEATFTVTYEDVTIGEPIDDERFEPPQVNETGTDDGTDDSEPSDDPFEIVLPTITEYETVEEAAGAVPFAVAEPPAAALPETVSLETISGYEFHDENRTQVSLFYRGAGETVSVTTGDAPRGYASGGDPVEVDGAVGSLERTGQGTELEWACGDRHYSIFASDGLDDGLALAVGESIGCPAS